MSKTEHSPDDTLRLQTMSKKAEIYKKELEIQDPLVERLGDIGWKMLSNSSYWALLNLRKAPD